MKHIESANTMFSFIWWLLGFYWVTAGGQELIEGSPQLYWFVSFQINGLLTLYLFEFLLIFAGLRCRLCITFLAFDVVFVLICVAIACLVGIAICCCLPCIIAILYAVTDQVVSTSFGSIFWFQFIASLTRLVVNGHNPIVLLFIDKTLFCIKHFKRDYHEVMLIITGKLAGNKRVTRICN